MSSLNVSLPIHIKASNRTLLAEFPNLTDSIWQVDFEIGRNNIIETTFKNILFVESSNIAYIYGIENENGECKDILPSFACNQKSFIQFLRAETKKNLDALGLVAFAFEGCLYSCESKATSAYIRSGSQSTLMGIGYRNIDGDYELIHVEEEDFRIPA